MNSDKLLKTLRFMEHSSSLAAAPVIKEAADEIERLRAVLLAITQLGGRNDLPDAWTLARAALEERT